MMLFTRAAGFTPLWSYEVSQAYITSTLVGSRFESDHFGKVKRKADGQPRDDIEATLERRNHAFAVQRCAKLLDGYGINTDALAWGRPIHSFVPPLPEECSADVAIPEVHLNDYRNSGLGGCGCQSGCQSACRSCWLKTLPCTFRCKCGEGCKNALPSPALEKVSPEEMKTLALADIVARLTPRDIEFFASAHSHIVKYSLQIKLCSSKTCWFCTRVSGKRLDDLDWFPVYNMVKSPGSLRDGVWMPDEWFTLLERQQLLKNPETRRAALACFLSDAYQPATTIKAAWAKMKTNRLSRVRALWIATATNTSPAGVLKLFEQYTTAAAVNARVAAAAALNRVGVVAGVVAPAAGDLRRFLVPSNSAGSSGAVADAAVASAVTAVSGVARDTVSGYVPIAISYHMKLS